MRAQDAMELAGTLAPPILPTCTVYIGDQEMYRGGRGGVGQSQYVGGWTILVQNARAVNWVSEKAGVWTMDWTMDWTMETGLYM